YLEPSPGKPSLNLMKMAKQGLAFELRNILHKAKKEDRPILKENISVSTEGKGIRNIGIEAIPLPNIVEPHYLVLFHEGTPSNGTPGTKGKKRSRETEKGETDEKDLRIQQLERELAQS